MCYLSPQLQTQAIMFFAIFDIVIFSYLKTFLACAQVFGRLASKMEVFLIRKMTIEKLTEGKKIIIIYFLDF